MYVWWRVQGTPPPPPSRMSTSTTMPTDSQPAPPRDIECRKFCLTCKCRKLLGVMGPAQTCRALGLAALWAARGYNS